MDVTGFSTFFLNLLVSGVTQCYGILDSVYFFGVSILDYLLWIFILSALIPIIFTIVRTQSSRKDTRPDSRASERSQLGQARGDY